MRDCTNNTAERGGGKRQGEEIHGMGIFYQRETPRGGSSANDYGYEKFTVQSTKNTIWKKWNGVSVWFSLRVSWAGYEE